MKRLFITLVALISIQAFAQENQSEMKALLESNSTEPTIFDTKQYAIKDSSTLKFDMYYPNSENDKKTTVIYVFGGGFVMGERDGQNNIPFYKELSQRGYRVIAIDYRLGLKGVTKVSPFNPKPVFKAVKLATEDLLSATKYLIDNHSQLNIDTSRMVIIGSSAGAITVLQTDYEMSNRSEVAQILPENFRFRGVVSLAGAIFSTKGSPTYPRGAAPTMMVHGTADKVVVYKKIQIFKLGMFGTDALVKIFEKNNFPYYALRYVDAQHEVAEFPRQYNTDEICNFIDRSVNGTFTNQIDATVKDRYTQENFKISIGSLDDLYKK